MTSNVPPPDPPASANDEEGPWLNLVRRVREAFSPVDDWVSDSQTLDVSTNRLSPQKTPMIQASAIKDTLQNFVSSTTDIQGAALVSPDGLPLTSVLPASMDEERTSAMSAAMLSLGERIGQELSRGVLERIFVEGEKGYSVLIGCGEDAVLLILASKEAKQGLLFLEIKRLVREITPLIT
ncbi:MAG: roadblock/LC7 domain-containing protein [Cyanophyceae cyanobacterium]